MLKLLVNLKASKQLRTRTRTQRTYTFKAQRWNNRFNFTSLSLRTRLHYCLFLMSACEVESEGLGELHDVLLERLNSDSCRLQNLQALYFTVMTLQSDSHQNSVPLFGKKYFLPSHLNGNVSQSPRICFPSVAFEHSFFPCCSLFHPKTWK